MIPNRKHVRYARVIQNANSCIGILLLGGLCAIVDDIPNTQHHLDVQLILILGNPVGLAVHYLGKKLCFILRVRQDDDGKVLSFKDLGQIQQKH